MEGKCREGGLRAELNLGLKHGPATSEPMATVRRGEPRRPGPRGGSARAPSPSLSISPLWRHL
eukprot:8983936-Pyramimonas_sp.AAC.1